MEECIENNLYDNTNLNKEDNLEYNDKKLTKVSDNFENPQTNDIGYVLNEEINFVRIKSEMNACDDKINDNTANDKKMPDDNGENDNNKLLNNNVIIKKEIDISEFEDGKEVGNTFEKLLKVEIYVPPIELKGNSSDGGSNMSGNRVETQQKVAIDKAAIRKARDQRYRERHREEINRRRRENRLRRLLESIANGSNVNRTQPVPKQEFINKEPSKDILKKERDRKYRERHREEIRQRQKEKRQLQYEREKKCNTRVERDRKCRDRLREEIHRRQNERKKRQCKQNIQPIGTMSNAIYIMHNIGQIAEHTTMLESETEEYINLQNTHMYPNITKSDDNNIKVRELYSEFYQNSTNVSDNNSTEYSYGNNSDTLDKIENYIDSEGPSVGDDDIKFIKLKTKVFRNYETSNGLAKDASYINIKSELNDAYYTDKVNDNNGNDIHMADDNNKLLRNNVMIKREINVNKVGGTEMSIVPEKIKVETDLPPIEYKEYDYSTDEGNMYESSIGNKLLYNNIMLKREINENELEYDKE